MREFLSEEVRRNPFPLYAKLREAGGVVREPTSGLVLVADYENVKRVLMDHETFSSAAAGGGAPAEWMLFLDPPRHTKLRALVSRAFGGPAVAGLEPQIRRISKELLRPWLERAGKEGPVTMDLASYYAVPLPLMVIAGMLGAPMADWPRFRAWSEATMGLIHMLTPGADAQAAVGAFRTVHGEMDAFVARLADERRAAPRDDLLTRLVHAEENGERLSHAEILGFFQLLLLAGHETTANLIGSAVLCMLAQPDAGVRLDPRYIPPAIEEVLRWRSPVQMSFRVARRDVTLGGQAVSEGSLVLAMIGSANHDERVFAMAEAFDIGRSPNPHLAFGSGLHSCIGAPLARLEARVALTDALALPNLARAGEWKPREAFHVHGPSELPVRFG